MDGREPYPWQELLPLAGLVLRTDTIYDARLGINTGVNPQGEVIATGINPGGAAEAAGMQSGDVIVSVGTVKITDQNESFVQFRSSYAQGTPGSALPIVVKRNNQELTLQGQLRLVPRADSRIQLDPSAGEKAVRIREGILHGKVDS